MTVEPSSPRKTRKELLSEWRHSEVLQAARGVFARLGYTASSVDDIAKEAGMAKGTIYLYFKSKEEIFAAVLGSDMEALTDRTMEAMSAVDTFGDRLLVFLNLRLVYLRNNQDFLRMYFAELGGPGSCSRVISEMKEQHIRRVVEFLRSCLERAMDSGEIRAVPLEATAFAILDLARGFAERHLRGWAHLTLEEDVAFTHSLILTGLQKT
jgi:AcrR family transcriptional regulator